MNEEQMFKKLDALRLSGEIKISLLLMSARVCISQYVI